MKKILLSNIQLKQAKEFYNAGLSLKKIGELFRLKYNTIRSLLIAAGISIRTPAEANKLGKLYSISETDHTAIISMYLSGCAVRTIQKQFNLSTAVIKRILVSANITLRTQSECNSIHQHCNNLKEEEITGIISMYCTGSSLAAIKKVYHINVEKIKETLINNNITLRSKKESYALRDRHSRETCMTKYGVINATQASDIKEKIRNTNIKRYGSSCSLNNPVVKAKAIATTMEHFGVPYSLAAKTVHEKGYKHSLEKYGYIPGQFGSPEHDAAMLVKYGRYICTSTTSYQYNSQYFDSLPELAFYIYYHVLGYDIKREPKKILYYFANKAYNYVPDFEINGQLYEIKGSQFLNEDGTWCNPYNHELDRVAEAKHLCALANNVKILYPNDYKKYLDWFYARYKKEDFIVIRK